MHSKVRLVTETNRHNMHCRNKRCISYHKFVIINKFNYSSPGICA